MDSSVTRNVAECCGPIVFNVNAWAVMFGNELREYIGRSHGTTEALRATSRGLDSLCAWLEDADHARTHWSRFHSVLETMKCSCVTKLGCGFSSRVWLIRDSTGQREYAWKIVDCKLLTESHLGSSSDHRYANEAVLLAQLAHDHIVKMFSWAEVPGSLLIALEYLPGGTLMDYVNANGPCTEGCGLRFASQLADVVVYLHCLHILHRDFKLENIVLASSEQPHCTLKVCDFGFARQVAKGCRCFTVVGTPVYMAPEIHALSLSEYASSAKGYGFPVDMWSIGIVIYASFCVAFPFDGRNISQQVVSGTVRYDDDDWFHLPRARDLVSNLLERHPGNRITAMRLRDVV